MHQVTGVFSSAAAAEQAVHELVQDHFNPDDISLLVTDQKGTHEEGVEHDTGIAEGAVGGAAVGGILGALGATLVATGIIVAPGIAVWATGPLVAALKGAIAGSAAGFGFGSLAGLGFWEDEAHIHADGLKRGGVVVAVPAIHQHAEEARKIFAECGAIAVRG